MIENVLFKIFQTLSSELSSKAKDYAKEILDDFKEKMALESELNIYLKSEEDKHYNSHSEEYEFVFEDIPKIIRNNVFDLNSLRNVFRAVEEGHTNEIDTICTLCIQSANCANEHAKNKVRQIVINCYKIVDEFFSSKISVENGCLLKKGVDAVNSHTDLVGKEIVSEITKDLDRREQKLEDVLLGAMDKLMSKYQSGAVNQKLIESDNKKYLGALKNSLFLDQDNPKLTLESMYIEPMVRNGGAYFSECLAEWINSSTYFMMLYGEAGIGKTSLVAKLVDEACKRESCMDNPNDAPVLAVELRRHCECFVNDEDLQAEDVLCQLFNVQSISVLSHKLLILDGLDEVTVLVPEFTREKANDFLRNLCIVSNNSYEGFYILVTSRDGYFDRHFTDEKIMLENLCWKEKQVSKWCEKYSNIKSECNEWCQRFLHQYHKLPRDIENDKRHEILCIPFILYLCCNSEIDLEQNRNICQIYDAAFRTILMRKHGKNTSGIEKLESNKEDKRKRIVLWQFTKELAYQMYLLGTLSLSESNEHNSLGTLGFSRAKKRTKQIIEKNTEYVVNDDELTVTSLLAVFSFASNDGTKGLTFAHKTVYEYFTAIKIYEDYLARFNKAYFESTSKDQKAMDVLTSIIEAFRYHRIPKEIFFYLIELCRKAEAPFSGTYDPLPQGFDYESYLNMLNDAVNEEYVSELQMLPPVKEYFLPRGFTIIEKEEHCISYTRPNIYKQISRAFRSAIWLLSGCADCLKHKKLSRRWLELIAYKSDQQINMSNLGFAYKEIYALVITNTMFRDAIFVRTDFSYAVLKRMFLAGVDFSEAILYRAEMSEAYLCNAILKGADLKQAILNGAVLDGGTLRGADLRGADLRNASVSFTDFTNAIFNDFTLFPEGFNPIEYGMITE